MKYNLVDSCGWLEYFAGSENAFFFRPIIELKDHVIVPIICIFEVYKRTLDQRTESDVIIIPKVSENYD